MRGFQVVSVSLSLSVIVAIQSISAGDTNPFGNDAGSKTTAKEKQDAFLRSLQHYEVIHPAILDKNGDVLTHDLKEIQNPRKFRRSLPVHKIHRLPIGLHLGLTSPDSNRQLNLNLTWNDQLLSKGFLIEKRRQNISETELFSPQRHHRCMYRGHVNNGNGTMVAVSACRGLKGLILTENEEYFIEPVVDHVPVPNAPHPHVMYKRSDIPVPNAYPDLLETFGKLTLAEEEVRGNRRGSCGVTELTETDEEDGLSAAPEDKPKHRSRRSVSQERFVETMIVVDHNMIEFYHDQDVELYVLSIMNMVSSLYHDASIGNLINIVLVKLIFLEEEEVGLNITHHADNTLYNFCRWQNLQNAEGDDDPFHHDTAVLITRKDICQGINQPCATLGLAHTTGMCRGSRSCTINEDTGLALAYTISHEMGHTFGMNHDGDGNHCFEVSTENSLLMGAQLEAHRGPMKWSRCSREYMSRFLDRGWGDCLLDEPGDHDFHFPHLPVGVMYNADYQCQLMFGEEATVCSGYSTGMCGTLWCELGRFCHTKMVPAAPGTRCGENMWCYNNECVQIARIPAPIPGDWGEWGDLSGCSRTCGGGVSIKERHCNNPLPSNGGRYCVGERKKYAICNQLPCHEDAPDIRAMQCTMYDDNTHQWMDAFIKVYPCKLFCRIKPDGRDIVKKSNTVIDGTPCTSNTRDICINGGCYKVGCDQRVNSNAVEDTCGVCHGDGSSCEQFSDKYDEQDNGYVDITIIPVGARNIRIQELAESNNFLALKDSEGRMIEVYNHHYADSNGADEVVYKAGGTTITYKRTGRIDEIIAEGPLTEPLHVMGVIYGNNPGIQYKYYLPKPGNISYERPRVFEWIFEDWTPCSASCGSGAQRSVVRCSEVIAGVVEDKYCNGSKPDDIQRTCNNHPCPAMWFIAPWQQCSVTCGGGGVRQRSAFCIRQLARDEQMVISSDECLKLGMKKPVVAENCKVQTKCPSEADWSIGEWSECSVPSCGEGYQRRSVLCSRTDGRCEEASKPEETATCVTPCIYQSSSYVSDGNIFGEFTSSLNPQYTFGEWEKERETTSDETFNRINSKVDSSIASNNFHVDSENFLHQDALNDPERDPFQGMQDAGTRKYLMRTLFRTKWQTDEWGECSVTCGEGTQSRRALCVFEGTPQPAEGCLHDTKPETTASCSSGQCHPSNNCPSGDTWDYALCKMALDYGNCVQPLYQKLCCETCANAR